MYRPSNDRYNDNSNMGGMPPNIPPMGSYPPNLHPNKMHMEQYPTNLPPSAMYYDQLPYDYVQNPNAPPPPPESYDRNYQGWREAS